mmetsp:Transcript_22238/g.56121  ORF Transcript_22238/g.56121 Transcript_22238/m.56121 type:complete len:224 (-) Transcript_22238:1354-2025(-)
MLLRCGGRRKKCSRCPDSVRCRRSGTSTTVHGYVETRATRHCWRFGLGLMITTVPAVVVRTPVPASISDQQRPDNHCLAQAAPQVYEPACSPRVGKVQLPRGRGGEAKSLLAEPLGHNRRADLRETGEHHLPRDEAAQPELRRGGKPRPRLARVVRGDQHLALARARQRQRLENVAVDEEALVGDLFQPALRPATLQAATQRSVPALHDLGGLEVRHALRPRG